MGAEPTGRAGTTVVIPAFQAEHTIGRCLRALRDQTLPPDEVLVVDDGSTDATAELAEGLGARVLRQTNRGPAAARNRGAREARGDVLLFTDDDCAPVPTWAQELVAPLADPEVVGVKGSYSSAQREPVARFVQLEYEERYARMQGRESIDFVDTYSAAYRRGPFLEAGGFDESFPTASVEDQELSFRMAASGHRMVFAPRATVEHLHTTAIGGYARRKFLIGYWKVKVLRRHGAKLISDSHTPQALKLQMALAAATGIATALAPVSRRAASAASVSAAGFAISAAPTMRHVARRDPRLLALAPILLAVRALALGGGLGAGVLARPIASRLGGGGVTPAPPNHRDEGDGAGDEGGQERQQGATRGIDQDRGDAAVGGRLEG